MGVLGPRRAGPVAEAERRVGVAADANWPHQISTIHLNFLARQKYRLVPTAKFMKDFARYSNKEGIVQKERDIII